MWEVDGLPVHVLLVHAVVVLVPTAAASVVLAAWSRRLRHRLGLVPVALSAVALVLTPLTVEAGEDLRRRLPGAPLIGAHAEQGGRMLPWVAGLVLAAVAVHLVGRRADADALRDGSSHRAGAPVVDQPTAPSRSRGIAAVPLLVALVATAVALGSTVQTVRTGESGARAVWEGST